MGHDAASYGPVIRDNGAAHLVRDSASGADARRVRGRRRPPSLAQPQSLYSRAYTIRLAVARARRADVRGRASAPRPARGAGLVVEGQYSGRYALARAERALWRGDPQRRSRPWTRASRWFAEKEIPVLHVPSLRHGRPGPGGRAPSGRATRGPADDVAAAVAGDRSPSSTRSRARSRRTWPEPGRSPTSSWRAPERRGRAVAGCRARRTRTRGGRRIAAVGGASGLQDAAYARWRRRRGSPGRRATGRRPGPLATPRAVGDPARCRAAARPRSRRSRGGRRLDLWHHRQHTAAARPPGSVAACRPSGRRTSFGLTRREREVLALVAEG